MLTARFADALSCAQDWHRAQMRKGSSTPYIAHLLSVAALVLEAGGTEDEAIAAAPRMRRLPLYCMTPLRIKEDRS